MENTDKNSFYIRKKGGRLEMKFTLEQYHVSFS